MDLFSQPLSSLTVFTSSQQKTSPRHVTTLWLVNVSKGSSFRFRLRQGVRRTFLIYSLPALIPRASPSSSDIKLRRCLPFFHPAACLIYLHATAEIIEVRRLVKLPPGRSRLVRQLARDSKSLRPLSLSHTICPCFGHLCALPHG